MSKIEAVSLYRGKPRIRFLHLLEIECRCAILAPSTPARITPRGNGGGASRDRTDDLKLAKLALSQLSYGPAGRSLKLLPFAQARWWAEKELNLRPHAYQACALTT